MPKTVMLTNTVLLACLSLLGGSGLISLLGGGVDFGCCSLSVLWGTALACAVIFLLTETLTGITWVPLVVLAGLITGRVMLDGTAVTRASEIAWAVGWVAMAIWFAYLAARARENRW